MLNTRLKVTLQHTSAAEEVCIPLGPKRKHILRRSENIDVWWWCIYDMDMHTKANHIGFVCLFVLFFLLSIIISSKVNSTLMLVFSQSGLTVPCLLQVMHLVCCYFVRTGKVNGNLVIFCILFLSLQWPFQLKRWLTIKKYETRQHSSCHLSSKVLGL